MIRCTACNTKLIVTNTYTVPAGNVHRRECPKCNKVHVTETKIVVCDPAYGNGAAAIAKKRRIG